MAKDTVKLEDCLSLVKKGAYKTLIDQVAITEDFPTMHKLIECKDITSDDVTKMVDCIMKFHDETDSEKKQYMYIEVLNVVTKNLNMKSEVAEKVCEFAIKNNNTSLLPKIARHSSLTPEIAKKICDADNNLIHWKITTALECLAENEKTPDDILFFLFKKSSRGKIRDNAAANITNRYKAFKEKLNETEDGQKLLKLLTDIS